MRHDPFSLDVIRVASPCQVPWTEMSGDEQVRFCDHCQLNVYNLSDLSRTEVESLIKEKEGNLCVRFHRRTDGTILTQDCPVGWRKVRRAVARRIVAFASLLIALLFGSARGVGADRRWSGSRCIHWLEGRSPRVEAPLVSFDPVLLQPTARPLKLDDIRVTQGRLAPPKNKPGTIPPGLLKPMR